MFRSATAKLTMWYLGIVMVISLGFSVVVYHFATNELVYGLNSQTQRIFRQFPVFNNNPYLQVREHDLQLGSHRIFLNLVYFNILVLAGAGLASYWLAKRTLAPIEASHEQQKRFTADVSHELRTPLTSLKMGSEVALLDKRASAKELREALESNIEEATKMEQLINNLLRLTSLDSASAQINMNTVQSDAILQPAIDQVAPLAHKKQMTISNESAPCDIVGDADSLTQLIVILLENAVKYSPDKSTILLTSKQADDHYHLSIRDTGQGIGADALPHVFERFYREDSARTTAAGEGYGLGLSIAKLIADKNNATITLTSQVGTGTTAVLSLPLAKATGSMNQH